MWDPGLDRSSPSPPFRTSIEVVAGHTVVQIGGELDIATRPRADAALFAAQAVAGPKGVLVDLTGVTFVAVTGINMLVEAANRARAAGIEFSVVPGQAERLIELCSLTEHLALRRSLTDRRSALAE